MPSSGTTGSLLRTKLHRPPVPRDYVRRARLDGSLLTTHPVTLVSAAAGFGKSVLVSGWLDGWTGPSAWVSLDESDNDLRQFMSYVCAAVETVFPSALPEVCDLLNAPTLPPATAVAHALINELDAIEEPFILVLDDVHLISDRAVLDMLSEVMERGPRNLHLVLIGRRDPFLPIARLRARNQLAEVRSEELSFTVEETEAFLENVLGTDLSAAVAGTWMERTEGWATGLRLAALALRGGSDVPEFPFAERKPVRDVMSYLMGEVLERQPPAVRDHLLRSSIAARFCAPLCDALAGAEGPDAEDAEPMDGAAFVEWLEQAGLFVIPLDAEHGWYRYHHLFRELLREETERQLGAEGVSALHSCSAEWFEAEGLITESIEHALAAGNVELAVDIIERHRHSEFNEDRWYNVERWLDRVPPGIRHQRPALLLAEAWIEYARFQVQRTAELVERAASLAGEADKALWGEISFFQGMFQYWTGQPEASEKTLERALELLANGEPHIECDVELHLGLARCMAGKRELAVASLEERIRTRVSPGKGDPLRRGGLVLVHLVSGDLPRAREEAEGFWRVAAERGSENLASWSSYLRGSAHLHAFDLKRAARHFSRVVEQRYVVETRAAIDAFTGLTLTFHFMGSSQRALDTAAQLEQFTRALGDFTLLARSCQARLSSLRGDSTLELDWARFADEEPDPAGLVFWTDVPAITRARVLIAAGTEADQEAALGRLDVYHAACERWNYVGQMIEIAVLQALALSKLGQNAEATERMEHAIAMAGPGGWIRPFVEAGTEVQRLLMSLRQQGDKQAFVGRVVAAFHGRNEPAPSSAEPSRLKPDRDSRTGSLVEDLTSREMDVLELLAERLQDKEIAARLYVTTHTVNHHLKRIYRKLDVSGRRQAVHRATELGIMEGQPQA